MGEKRGQELLDGNLNCTCLVPLAGQDTLDDLCTILALAIRYCDTVVVGEFP